MVGMTLLFKSLRHGRVENVVASKYNKGVSSARRAYLVKGRTVSVAPCYLKFSDPALIGAMYTISILCPKGLFLVDRHIIPSFLI